MAPSLTRFALQQPPLIQVDDWSFHWGQLTSLALTMDGFKGMGKLRFLVQQLENIRELRFALDGGMYSIDEPGPAFDPDLTECLPHLLILEVPCVDILGLIKAPLLQELHMTGFFAYYTPDYGSRMEMIREFIRHSSCRIQKLALDNFLHFDIELLVDLFSDVTELCIENASECIQLLLSPAAFPGLRVLRMPSTLLIDYCPTFKKVLQLRNGSSPTGAVALEKIVTQLRYTQREEMSNRGSTREFLAALMKEANVELQVEYNVPMAKSWGFV